MTSIPAFWSFPFSCVQRGAWEEVLREAFTRAKVNGLAALRRDRAKPQALIDISLGNQ